MYRLCQMAIDDQVPSENFRGCGSHGNTMADFYHNLRLCIHNVSDAGSYRQVCSKTSLAVKVKYFYTSPDNFNNGEEVYCPSLMILQAFVIEKSVIDNSYWMGMSASTDLKRQL